MRSSRLRSPTQIRRRAAVVVRNWIQREFIDVPRPTRAPDDNETPLSDAEIQHGIFEGLIRQHGAQPARGPQ